MRPEGLAAGATRKARERAVRTEATAAQSPRQSTPGVCRAGQRVPRKLRQAWGLERWAGPV